jgi:hypothetical protein
MSLLNRRDEIHAAVWGAYSGFVTGLTGNVRYAGLSAEVVLGGDDVHEHPADAHDEAAYAGVAFMVWFVIGRVARQENE